MQQSLPDEQPAAAHWSAPSERVAADASILREYFQLTKPRIALLIVISTAVGYCFGTTGDFGLLTLFHTLLGTALMAAGSATLNQWYERDVDAKMKRTRNRPIPAGTIPATHAFYFGVLTSLLGAIELWLFANPEAALLSCLTSVGYLLVYTPLKRKGPLCTTVGAIPGAMPPLIGFAAAHGHLAVEAWVLFGILFLWQFPHFHAIAWMYREDYGRGDIKMLAVVEPKGRSLGPSGDRHARFAHSCDSGAYVPSHGWQGLFRGSASAWARVPVFRSPNLARADTPGCAQASARFCDLHAGAICISCVR